MDYENQSIGWSCSKTSFWLTSYWLQAFTPHLPVARSVRRADPLTTPAGLDDAGDDKLEHDFVILVFFVLLASPRDADSMAPVLDAGLPAVDRLLELPDSLPFSAGTAPPDPNTIIIPLTIRRLSRKVVRLFHPLLTAVSFMKIIRFATDHCWTVFSWQTRSSPCDCHNYVRLQRKC